MVNSPSDVAAPERRERPRSGAEHAPALGGGSALNPFGDLVTLQHLSSRLAKGLRPVLESMLRRPLRSWAEPIVVQRFADYRAERGDALSAWQGFAIQPGKGRAHLVLSAGFLLELLDCFFGGEGEVPSPLPTELSPAAETLVARLAGAVSGPLAAAWDPLAKLAFAPVAEPNVAIAPAIEGGDPVIVTRLGFAHGEDRPAFLDLLYPVAALKPHTAALVAKVQSAEAEIEPEWRSGLTRAVMGVRLPVRSVLAETVLPIGRLLELRTGDVIPIEFGPEVPVMVARRRLGTGLVGTANGHAAVRLTSIDPISPEDMQ